MKPEPRHDLDRYRRTHPTRGRSPDGTRWGFFVVPGKQRKGRRRILFVMVGDMDGWEHVSVSTNGPLPTWEEMCRIKALWWGPEETVLEYHPPESAYVSQAEVLHMWRPSDGVVPMPPVWMVGTETKVAP